jgi:hypothetical protein
MDRPADWRCPNEACVNSLNMVFGTRESCPKCGTGKDARALTNGTVHISSISSAPSGTMVRGSGREDCGHHAENTVGWESTGPLPCHARNGKNPGDWQCPTSLCVNNRNNVFGSKSCCPMCGAGKPVAELVPPLLQTSHLADSRIPEERQCPIQDLKCQEVTRGGAPSLTGILNPVYWQRPLTNLQQYLYLDDEMLSLYCRQERLETWIWDRLLETPRSAEQWASLQRDMRAGAYGTSGLKLLLQAYRQEQAAEYMPSSRSRHRPSPY